MEKFKKSSTAGAFKPYSSCPVQDKKQFLYCPIPKGTHSLNYEPKSIAGSVKSAGVPINPNGASKDSNLLDQLDILSKGNQLLSTASDSFKLMKDASDMAAKLNRLQQMSSQLRITVQAIHIREITELILFLDDFTAVALVRVRELKMLSISTNIDEVLRSMDELSGLLDTRLKRFGEKLVSAIAYISRLINSIPSRTGIAKKLSNFAQNMPRLTGWLSKLQTFMKGPWLSFGGLAVSLEMTDKRKDEYQKDPKSQEKWDKYVIEFLGFLVSAALLIIGAIAIFFGGTVAIVIGAIILLYTLVNIAASFYDHQDLAAEVIYYHEEIYTKILGFIDDLENTVSDCYYRAKQYAEHLWASLKSLPGRLASAAVHKVTDVLADSISSISLPKFYY